MADIADALISGIQAGTAQRRQRMLDAQAAEDRAMQKDLLTHQLAQMKLDEKYRAWNQRKQVAELQQQMLAQTPYAQIPSESLEGVRPTQGFGGMATLPGSGTTAAPEMTSAPGTQGMLPVRPIPIQGEDLGLPNLSLPAQSKEQSMAQQLADLWTQMRLKAAGTPGNIPAGGARIVPGATPGTTQTIPGPSKVERPVAVHTTEGGRNVVKYVQPEEARGQTFAAPLPTQIIVGGGTSGGGSGYVLTAKPDPHTGNRVDPRLGLTPNAVWQGSIRFALTGQMPSLGLGSSPRVAAKRDAFLNTAGALAESAGTDLATLQAEYKANAGALSKLTNLYRGTAASVDAAAENMNLALQQSAQVGRTGAKLVNRYLQWVQGELTPAKGLTKLETYIYTAAREYAKVTSGAAMSAAGITDSAAREASKLLAAAQAPDSLQAAIEAMQGDMANVVGSQERQIANISRDIAGFLKVGTGPKTTAELPLGASPRPGPSSGTVSVTAPDGSVHVFPNQAAADKFKQLAGIK